MCLNEFFNAIFENIDVDNTGCLLISVACLGINNLMIFWSLRAEILGKQTSKVYKLIHMKGLIKKLSYHQ